MIQDSEQWRLVQAEQEKSRVAKLTRREVDEFVAFVEHVRRLIPHELAAEVTATLRSNATDSQYEYNEYVGASTSLEFRNNKWIAWRGEAQTNSIGLTRTPAGSEHLQLKLTQDASMQLVIEFINSLLCQYAIQIELINDRGGDVLCISPRRYHTTYVRSLH